MRKARNILVSLVLLFIPLCTFAGPIGKVLVILSGVDAIELIDHRHKTIKHPAGFFLNELMVPVSALLDAGYEVQFATPAGRPAVTDATSYDVQYFKSQQELDAIRTWIAIQSKNLSKGSFGNPIPFKDIQEKEIRELDLVFLPGGYASMQDLQYNDELGRILRQMAKDPAKIIAANGHAPIALTSATSYPEARWPFANRRMTGTSHEEAAIAQKDWTGRIPFQVEGILRFMRARYESSAPFQSHIVRDQNLVTGQNSQSAYEMAEWLLVILNTEKIGRNGIDAWMGDVQSVENAISTQRAMKILIGRDTWRTGYPILFIGKKVGGLTPEKFNAALAHHIGAVSFNFAKMGLQGYLSWTDGERVISFQTWSSEDAAHATFKSPTGMKIFKEAQELFIPGGYFAPVKDRECRVMLETLCMTPKKR
jgi:putative intracellular protease/amidase